ncbi:glycoside hydrolase family 3 C-terminal domain-containing protein [Actinoplanes sp. CA-051413]|uniref:glycoside hydrolase family 3 C-terminal domain-containing protein n=1 Tax=Actinoplanes sp. CA-051413 TaxID=3239899 RepID=UPI003D981452
MADSVRGTFQDPGRPLADRVTDLLSRLTLPEKVALLHQHQAPVPRLGVGPFRTGTEALHGVAWLGEATVFPQSVGLGSSWDPELVRRVGAAVGDEVRGLHHKDPAGVGLNVWAPVVNPLRDPRWGRNEEGYAEDPWLTGVLGGAYARGLRGDDPRYLRTAPTLKHFLGYNNETERHLTSSDLPPRVLHEYELPAFREPIASGAAVAVMASYNLVNGRPTHLSPLLADELRTWTADDVLVVGDAYACSNLAGEQGYLSDHAAAFAAALRAGVDCFTEDATATLERLHEALERGLLTGSDVDAAAGHILAVRFRLGEFDPEGPNPYAATTAEVVNCVEHQRLAREAARSSVVLLKNSDAVLPLAQDGTIAVLGPLADTVLADWYSGTLPYAVTARAGLADRLGEQNVRTAEGVDRVRLRTATGTVLAGDGPDGAPLRVGETTTGLAAGFDLLDWGGGTITLRAAANRRYVRADENGVLVNDRPEPGEWVVRETFEPIRHRDAVVLRHLASNRYVAAGPDGVLRADAATEDTATAFTLELAEDGVAAAAALARDADVALVLLGNHPMVAGRETEDRIDLALPPRQEALLRAVRAANPRTVLVLTSSYPYAVGWAQEHLPALVWSAHGGQEFGAALADVLLGETPDGEPVEPTGRLPQTWYRGADELPDLLDYDIIGSDATYLYFRGRPLYPFGHGLGYTRFEHHDLRLSAEQAAPGEQVEVSVDVVNVGERPGTEVVQFYTRQRRSRDKQPLRQLRGFRRVRLAPGERATVTMPLRVDDLAFYDVVGERPVVEAARHSILAGRSCTDITATATLTVHGEVLPERRAGGDALRAASRDGEFGTALTDEGPQRGDAVVALRDGAWLAFDRVDFGAGGHRITAATAAAGPGARIEVRLDEPLSGPVAAVLDVPATAGRHDWIEVAAPLAGATGRRDLYLVFPSAGARLSGVRFSPVG